MSGRPAGPYTVKYLRTETSIPYRWWKVYAHTSAAFFEAAYGDIGLSVLKSSDSRLSLDNEDVPSPYMLEVEARTNFAMFKSLQASNKFSVPFKLTE